MGFIVDFGDTTKYQPKTGGSTDLVPKEGMYRAKISSVDEGKSGTGNATLRFNMLITDDDAKGLRVSKTIPVSGKNTKGQNNIDQLLPVYESLLSTTVADKDLGPAVQKMTNGRKSNSAEIIAEFLGKDVYLDIKVKPLHGDDGRVNWVSDVCFFIARGKLESFEKRGAHRRALPPQAEQYRSGGSSPTAAHTEGSTDDAVV